MVKTIDEKELESIVSKMHQDKLMIDDLDKSINK